VSFPEVQNSLHSHIPATSALEGDSTIFPFAMSSDVTDLPAHGTNGG